MSYKYLEYRSIADLNRLVISNLSIFPHNIDLVVGIPRSGMLPANLLSLYLNKPFTDIDSFIERKIYSSGQRGSFIDSTITKNILVVDDSLLSGEAMSKVKERLVPMSDEFNIEYAAIFISSKHKEKVNYYCEIIDYPRIFQWNIFHHPFFIPKSCFDIDGVLCPNPPIDDDGPLYCEYIANAKPLYIPSVEIDTLITCRLEKYRKITENWLGKNKVRYKHLVMLDFKTKEERARWGKHGEYKGQYYKGSNNLLFVESSLSEAVQIARISGKPVFCTETFEMINTYPTLRKTVYMLKRKIKDIVKAKILRIS